MVFGLVGVDGVNAPKDVVVEKGHGNETAMTGLRVERTVRGKLLTRRNATRSPVHVCIIDKA